MFRRVIYRDNQEVPAEDLNNASIFPQQTIDQSFRDFVTDQARFAGFSVEAAGTTSVTVARGRLFRPATVSDGDYQRFVLRVYEREDEVELTLLSNLPAVNRRIVAIVVWGDTIESSIQPRDFLIDADSEETEPRAVATEYRRFCNVEKVVGAESADPQPPTVSDANLVVAYVTLSPEGIESIEMVEANRIPSIEGNAGRIRSLEDWREQISPRVDTIASDLAKLAGRDQGDSRLLLQVAADVARLKERADIPDDAVDYGADRFLTLDETDEEDPTYNAFVEEGVRFAAENESLAQMSILDVYNPNVLITGDGLMLPRYTHSQRQIIAGPTTAVPLAQFQYSEQTMVKKTMSRLRIRYGEPFLVCKNNAWWKSGTYDERTGIFEKDGETFQALGYEYRKGLSFTMVPKLVRLRKVWEDYVDEPYWDAVTTTVNVAGRHVAQTFLNANDGWMTGVSLIFPVVAASGSVHLALTETKAGAPDISKMVASVTLEASQLEQGPTAWTFFPIGPVFLEGGQRYALVITTAGAHSIGTTSGANYAEGTYFQSSDGAFFAGDLTRDIRFATWFAKFTNQRTVVEMSPLSLSGGILGLDFLAEVVQRRGTADLSFEIQVNSAWHTISPTDSPPLNQAPPPALVPFRIVMNGTADVQPAIRLSGSRQKVFRPKTEFKHVSTERTLAAPSDLIHVITDLDGFDSDHHDFEVKLVTDGPTTETADSVTDVAMPGGFTRRTSVFELGEAVDAYQIVLEGSTDTVLVPFLVSERVDIAL